MRPCLPPAGRAQHYVHMCRKATRPRRTGFYLGVGAPTLLSSDPSLLPHRFWGCLRSMDWTLPGLGICQLHRVFLWARFSKNPLPRLNRPRMLPASGAVLAHNTRGDMSILRAPAELVLSGQGFGVIAFSMLSAGALQDLSHSASLEHRRSAIQYPKWIDGLSKHRDGSVQHHSVQYSGGSQALTELNIMRLNTRGFARGKNVS
jgi:hypothetical protein